MANFEHVLGTSLELQVVAAEAPVARLAEEAVLSEVDRLESILSGWSATSEFSRWVATNDVAVRVAPELIALLVASERWRAVSGGAF